MSNDYAPCFGRIDFAVIPSYIEYRDVKISLFFGERQIPTLFLLCVDFNPLSLL